MTVAAQSQVNMDFLPVFLDVKDRRCLVVGGGEVAARKINMLLRADAHVVVVAPQCVETVQRLQQQEAIVYHARVFAEADLEHSVLVVAATDDARLNQAVSEACRQKNIPINVVDEPSLCSFIFPSIVDRSPVIVAVSTGGRSPVLARLLRAKLESLIPAGYGKLASLMARFRQQVKQRFPEASQRRRLWENLLQGPVAELVFSGREQQAVTVIESQLNDAVMTDSNVGDVALVGAGPGDPDLLTFRALRLMQQADVVLYDRLVAPAILELVRRDAEQIYVGKKRDFHSMRQQEISQLMVQLAQEGKRVVRLKGGDPFIFGRGGEEIELLAEAGISFQVVPGITAAAGCASYAGIPLTHRDHAQSVVFVTGHLKDGRVNLNWDHLVQRQQTIVIYMGLHGLDSLCHELVAHGLPADTPIALIEQGTTPQQRVLTGTLQTLAEKVSQLDVHAPTLLIIGSVVTLHEQLAWFNSDQAS